MMNRTMHKLNTSSIDSLDAAAEKSNKRSKAYQVGTPIKTQATGDFGKVDKLHQIKNNKKFKTAVQNLLGGI